MWERLLICSGIMALLAIPSMAKMSGGDPGCNGAASNDIGPLFPAQPNGGFVVADGDCTGDVDCNDFLEMVCDGGETVVASLCQGGGSATWDTSLRALQGGPDIVCNDDSCGLQSEISFAAPAGSFEIRLDSFNFASGSYSLAVSAPSTCTIVGALPVTLQSFGVE